jgi:hypothetical protein
MDKLKTAADAEGVRRGTKQKVFYYSHALRQEELWEAINAADFSKLPDSCFTSEEKDKVKTRLLKRLHKADNVPVFYQAFLKRYTQDAEDKYGEIEAAIKRGDMVMGGTFAYKPKDLKSGGLGLNAEQLDRGIVQTHAYTVLGVETRGDVRFAKLRNPWGDGTVSYKKGFGGKISSGLVNEENEGIFLMEFNDFLAAFDSVTVN